MARQAILYTSRGPATFRNVRQDHVGYPLVLMEDGEVRVVTLDLTNALEPGETISSASVAAEGVTGAVATSSPTVTLTLSAPTSWGEAVVTITLSSGEKIITRVRARITHRYSDPVDKAYTL